MTIKEALAKYHGFEIDLLLSEVLKKSREFLYMNPNYKLSSYQVSSLLRMVKRRQNGEPMAYILGYKDFCGLRFKVNRNVLIPRPETEAIIERLKDLAHSIHSGQELKDCGREIKILDIGTGSGCIIISIANQLKNYGLRVTDCELFASDISKKALAVARENARIHHQTTPLMTVIKGLPLDDRHQGAYKYSHTSEYESICRIKFVQSNLLSKIKFVPDIIVANLPYGWQDWKNNTSAETLGLKFEPKQALYTKENGLYEIHRLLKQMSSLPSLPKLVYLEFDPRQKVLLRKLIKKTLPVCKTKFFKDFNNLWRFVEISL